jgi:hypothetical protein
LLAALNYQNKAAEIRQQCSDNGKKIRHGNQNADSQITAASTERGMSVPGDHHQTSFKTCNNTSHGVRLFALTQYNF